MFIRYFTYSFSFFIHRRWELLLCNSCGSKGIHIGCGKLDWATMEWDCEDCSSLVPRRNSGDNDVEIVEPPSVPSVSFDNFPLRSAMKRSHPSDGMSTGESSSGNGNDSEIDIISVADSESPSTSMIFRKFAQLFFINKIKF